MKASVSVPEVVESYRLDPAERFLSGPDAGETDGTSEQVGTALGALAADKEFAVVSVSGSRGRGIGAFLGVVEGVLNGLEGLIPPRQLVDLTYMPAGMHNDGIVAVISTQRMPQQPNPVA